MVKSFLKDRLLKVPHCFFHQRMQQKKRLAEQDQSQMQLLVLLNAYLIRSASKLIYSKFTICRS